MSFNWPLSRLVFGSSLRPFPQAWARVYPLCRCDSCGERHRLLLGGGAPDGAPSVTPNYCAARSTNCRSSIPGIGCRSPQRRGGPSREVDPGTRLVAGEERSHYRWGANPPGPSTARGEGPKPATAQRREEEVEPAKGGPGGREGAGGRGGAGRKGPIRESSRPGRKGWRRALPGAFPARPGDSLSQESPGPPGPRPAAADPGKEGRRPRPPAPASSRPPSEPGWHQNPPADRTRSWQSGRQAHGLGGPPAAAQPDPASGPARVGAPARGRCRRVAVRVGKLEQTTCTAAVRPGPGRRTDTGPGSHLQAPGLQVRGSVVVAGPGQSPAPGWGR